MTQQLSNPLPDKDLDASEEKTKILPPKTRFWRRKTGLFLWSFFTIIALGFVFPRDQTIPVQNASTNDWNHNTFWHHPWGRSGVHKGIDIFAKRGTPVVAATSGWIIAAQDLRNGGKTLSILGPGWRVHYYAHLDLRSVRARQWVEKGQVIGEVGTTGNARGKSPHLHYTVVTLVPYPWRISSESQGWKKAFFLNPDRLLRSRRDRQSSI